MQTPYKIVIVGGGTAGWMTAAALSTLYANNNFQITLIESKEIGSIGVGEATLPQMKDFNTRLGISEAEMMKKTQATFKLGIKFVDWGRLGSDYYHPFGVYGTNQNTASFYGLYSKISQEKKIADLSDYSYAIALCRQNKFELFSNETNCISSTYKYGYHFDASLYAEYLREFCQNKGVSEIDGKINYVERDKDTGNILSVRLESGLTIDGDFFIDCSGLRSLLLSKTLGVEFEDWSKWLVCDRAIALPSEKLPDLPPYTTSTAKEGGWQWKIPLQHRTGNGYVYASAFLSDQKAVDSLIESVGGQSSETPRLIKFKSGRYNKSWSNNCVAIGLSSGFLEPLESTSIYLIQAAIINFTKLFSISPSHEVESSEFNRLMDTEYDRIRDFLILHYHLNDRKDSELWHYCREMRVPEELTEKINIFKKRGHVERYQFGLFTVPSWVSVFNGQGVQNVGLDPFIAGLPLSEIEKVLKETKYKIDARAENAPSHKEFLNSYLKTL
ncbi:MAG: tryptophan 7-halogenase [Cellvibrio sp.]|uniref:tryptophan halogenase family protein n=1 Tax=Cellvibrio sp. TaxID=1965322 RepID=UPI002717D01D|nr:tryptophan 7-halogenase [Cellvibrio sp.]